MSSTQAEIIAAGLAPRRPSVTQILRAVGLALDYDRVPAHILEHAQQRGTALHRAIQYHAEGRLELASLHPEIQPGFQAYLRFVEHTGHVPIASEVELIHPAWQFIGHPDRIGWLGPERVVIDFKYVETVDLAGTALQVAAYALLWNAVHPTEPVTRRYTLQLRRNGTYRLHPLEDPHAEQIFLAALVVFQARERRHGTHGR